MQTPLLVRTGTPVKAATRVAVNLNTFDPFVAPIDEVEAVIASPEYAAWAEAHRQSIPLDDSDLALATRTEAQAEAESDRYAAESAAANLCPLCGLPLAGEAVVHTECAWAENRREDILRDVAALGPVEGDDEASQFARQFDSTYLTDPERSGMAFPDLPW